MLNNATFSSDSSIQCYLKYSLMNNLNIVLFVG